MKKIIITSILTLTALFCANTINAQQTDTICVERIVMHDTIIDKALEDSSVHAVKKSDNAPSSKSSMRRHQNRQAARCMLRVITGKTVRM
jgi:hypothetical protein